MPELVHDGVAYLAHRLPARRAGPQNRATKDRDLSGQVGDEPVALEERRASEYPEQLFVVWRIGLVVVFFGGLLLDDHDDVLKVPPKILRYAEKRLLDECVELPLRDPAGARHRRPPREKSRSKLAVVASATRSNET